MHTRMHIALCAQLTSPSQTAEETPAAAWSWAKLAAQQQAETWSIIQEAARQWIATCTDQEQGWVPRRGQESWLGLMWEVEVLRRGAVFGRSHELILMTTDDYFVLTFN
jgi:hypothetical protein